MEITLTNKQDVEATVAVTVPAKDVDAAFDRILADYARRIKVPGFRPGKAPTGMIVGRVGEEALTQDVREALIERAYPEAVKTHELEAVHAHPHGGNPSRGEDFSFELHMDLYPTVTLPDLSGIDVGEPPAPVTDEQVEETVGNLKRQHATLIPVERAATATDVVSIETLDENGEPREEGNAMPVDLESAEAELRDQLVGASIGDKVTLTLSDPSKRQEGDEETPTTELNVRIQDVKEKELPEADDEFAKTLGFDDWASTLDAIRDSLERQAREQADEARRTAFTDDLVDQTDVPLPNALVEQRMRNLLESLVDDLKRQGIGFDDYLAKLEADSKREEFDAELRQNAEKSVKRDLVLEQLLDEHPVEIGDAEFNDAVRYMAAQEGKTVDAFKKDRGDTWLRNYRFLMARDRAVRHVLSELTGEGPDSEPSEDDAEASS